MLVLKDDVGRSKRTTRDLPREQHTYGAPIIHDAVGVSRCKSLAFFIWV